MIVFESDDIKFESFIFQDVDELSNVVAKSFTNYEPLAVSQQTTLSEFKELIMTLSEECIELGLSYIAKDKKTNKIVGAILTNDFLTTLLAERIDSPASAILSDVSEQYRKANKIKEGKYLHVHFLSVDEFYHGKQIINTLIGICLDKAVNKGYEYVFLIVRIRTKLIKSR